MSVGKRLEAVERLRNEIESVIEVFDNDLEQGATYASRDSLISVRNNLITTSLICERVKSNLVFGVQ